MNKKARKLLERVRNKLHEERKVLKWRDVIKTEGQLDRLSPESKYKIAQKLAKKLGGAVVEHLGGGGWGIVYKVRELGEGRDFAMKVSMASGEPLGYTRMRRKKTQIEKKDPELASILPEIGEIVDIIYDYEEKDFEERSWPRFRDKSVRIYGISMELLESLPPRVSEQLFGAEGIRDEPYYGFKSKEAEAEWVKNISDPKILIPFLRDIYGEKSSTPSEPDRYYIYFNDKLNSGVRFEKEVLNLEPPTTYNEYLVWIRSIKSLTKKYGTDYKRMSIEYSSKEKIDQQGSKLKNLKDKIKIPLHPEEAPGMFKGDAYPTEEKEIPQVTGFYNKLKDLRNYGVMYWDTKAANTMMRPSTGEVVVSDVGHFQGIKKDKLEEITRAGKEGVKLPTVAEELTKYITNPDKPEYYMQFSYVNKLGINPSSKYNTPVGIYSYPITEYSLRSLMAGQIPFASDRSYIIVFKPRSDEGIIYNPDPGMGYAGAIPVEGFSGGLTRDEYFDFVKEIYSDDFVRTYSKKHMGKTFRSPMSWLRGAQRDVNVAKEGRITPSNKKMLKDIIVKVATKNYPPLQAKMDVSKWYTYVVNDYIQAMLRAPFGEASRQRAIASPGDWASKMYASTDSKRPSFGGKAERALKEAFAQLKEELIDKYIIRPETLEHRFSSAGPVFNQDPEQPWNSAPDWFMDIAVSDAFKSAAAAANQPHYLGILWNLTREAAHEDPIVWSSMLRKLGIAGVVDANKGSVIHASEPTQAVFFSRGDLELVEVFQNELSPYKVRQREVSEMLPVFHRAFIEKWGRKPSTQEREKFAYVARARGFTTQSQKVSFAEYMAQQIGEETEKASDHIDLTTQMI